ncbi:MAG: hypothetical protein GYA24_17705 [Candidatus Lokiarchaeota archaeon]|nr:hypothetical protein [Candidatus Lokiarchaeota archaeon]
MVHGNPGIYVFPSGEIGSAARGRREPGKWPLARGPVRVRWLARGGARVPGVHHFGRPSMLISARAPVTGMAGEQGGDPGSDPGEAGDGGVDLDCCDQCGVPLPDPRREYCALGAGCCADCMARCEQAGRCGKLRDPAAWAAIKRLSRLVRERSPR